ncbi:hypothetical protein CEK28_10065 [Xenophilus sp. AP218F]|nr:LEA type 2 family protein [Chromobacterium sp. ASV5]OWY39205.1 hypothetical protein CEK28_10065 [Xenophilus sp. AP218F]
MNKFAAVMLALLLGACSTLDYKKPQISVSDIQPGKTTLFEQNFDLTLRVKNPNDVALKAKGLQFDLNVGGERLGSGVSGKPLSIPAMGEGLVSLQLTTSLPAWLRQLGNLSRNDGKIAYEIQGRFLGVPGLGDVPFKSGGEWALPGGK